MLKGLLFIGLLFLIFMAIVVMLVVRFFWGVIVRMREMLRSSMGMGPGDGSAGDYTGRRTNQYTFSHDGRRRTYGTGRASGAGRTSSGAGQQSSGSRRTQTTSGPTVIDNRNPEQARRKIFSENEGEYVDFEES